MNTCQKIRIVILTLCVLTSFVQGRTEKQTTIFDFEGSFNYQNVKKNNANFAINKGRTGKALEIFLKKDCNPSITIKSQPWQVSHHAGIAIDITNTGTNNIGIIAEASINNTKSSLESFVWVEPGKTEILFIVFRRKHPPKYMDKYFRGMNGLPGPFLWHWLTPDLDKLNSLKLYTAKTNKNVLFQIDNVRGISKYTPPTENELKSDFFPFVDKFGQYKHRQWPGKTTSQDDIRRQHKEELKDILSNQGPDHWNKYGGWKTGPKLEATGHFRTEKINEKWWLVDPEGRLFWSQGVTGVRLSQATRIWGREEYFSEIPEYNDFREANLKRKYGNNWKSEAGSFIHRRLRSWGMNTIANWSDKDIYSMQKTPYVVSMGSGIAKEMPNILDETEFRKKVQKRINANTVKSFKDDPWCLGVFVDNELRWPKNNTAAVAETYYKVVGEELKNVAPNILYLGSRIHGSGKPLPAYIAASKHCDIVSINRYKFVVINEDLPQGSVDKPMIIGEFHFGALDRGLLHTGLKGVIDQKQRANAYTFYLQQALQNDRIVGAHWFQHTDQLVSARADGENYQIGLVDITDRPYPELVDALRKLAQYLYQYRNTGPEQKK